MNHGYNYICLYYSSMDEYMFEMAEKEKWEK